jgi:hypothetical protein
MINPYMQNAKERDKIKYVHDNILSPIVIDQDQKPMFERPAFMCPYKTYESVVEALDNGDRPIDVLSKMDPSLRKDQEVMLSLIEKTDTAYMYVHKDINTLSFKQQAILKNPMVYDRLSDNDRNQQLISDAYRKSAFEIHVKKTPMDQTTMAILPEYQLSKKINVAQVLNDQALGSAAEHVVINGAYNQDGAWSKQTTLLALGGMKRAEIGTDPTQELMKDAWTKHPEVVAQLAIGDRNEVKVNHVLTAIESQAPEMRQMIAERQREGWEGRRAELQQMLQDQADGKKLNGYQIRTIAEAEKHIQIQPEQKQIEQSKHNQQQMQKEREVTNAYILRSAQDRIYSAAAVGDIDFSQATDIASNIGTAPSTSKSSQAASVIEKAESLENDIDNIDENREAYLEITADMDNPGVVPENVSEYDAAQYAAQGQSLQQQYDDLEDMYKDLGEDIMAPWDITDLDHNDEEIHREL